MDNPFIEVAGNVDDSELVRQAQHGDRDALEKLILRHQAWIYNVAVRMVFHPQDAEEVTQEVLIKAVTRLSTFKGESRFRTWLYRIVANHVLNMKRHKAEAPALALSAYGAAIDGTPDLDLPDPASVPVEVPMLVEEAKLSCTSGMLLCLDRRQRLVFTLGEIFGVSDSIGAEILEMSPDNFRQSLTRARRDLYSFMNNQCGLVNKNNPCRCLKKTRGFIEAGHIDPQHLRFAHQHVQRIRDVAPQTVGFIENAVEAQHAAIYRDHPFLPSADHTQWLRHLLNSQEWRDALHLT